MAGINGRPTKLTQEFINKADEYMDCWEELGEAIPSIAGLAVYTRVSRDSIHEWTNNIPLSVSGEISSSFSDIIDSLTATQELKLLSGGLSGSMNATITKLILHKHNYSDKAEVDNTSSDGSHSTDLKVTIVRPDKE